MTRKKKIILSPSRDIPFESLRLSQSNVRRVKAGISIEALAADIALRGLLQGLSVRPIPAEPGGVELFEVPAGGRRYRALESLVSTRRLSRAAPIPCIVKLDGDTSAEEDSYAENIHREPLHPLDQFRSMQLLVEQGLDIETIAARHMVTSAVVRQRLKLALVSPRLLELYAEDALNLEQLMAFAVSDDHARQEQVFELLGQGYHGSPGFIRARLTETGVAARDPRARFVGLDNYVAAGGGVMRDLFEEDDGGWLTDPVLLDSMVSDRLEAEAAELRAEGWKWVETATSLAYGFAHGLREIEREAVLLDEQEQARVESLRAEGDALEAEYEGASDMSDDIEIRLAAIDEELGGLLDRPPVFDADEVARAGAFLTFDRTGTILIYRGFVRPEDEPQKEAGDQNTEHAHVVEGAPESAGSGDTTGTRGTGAVGSGVGGEEDDEPDHALKPLPDGLVTDLTLVRTIGLRDALARRPDIAFVALIHALAVTAFDRELSETCLQIALRSALPSGHSPGLGESASARGIEARHQYWRQRLPRDAGGLWDAIIELTADEQHALLAHIVSLSVNAMFEGVPRYGDGRMSARAVAQRIGHSHVIARAVDLDMVAAGWETRPDNYLERVTKPHILAAIAEATGEDKARRVAHLKKPDMVQEAAGLLAQSDWLPEPLRTPGLPVARSGSHELEEPVGNDIDTPAANIEVDPPFDPPMSIAAE